MLCFFILYPQVFIVIAYAGSGDFIHKYGYAKKVVINFKITIDILYYMMYNIAINYRKVVS